MMFYVDGKKERYNMYCSMKYEKLPEGMEVIAYVVGNNVVKFYKENCGKVRLSKNDIERLKKINTNRILLPTSTILDKKRQLRGYKMKYVENLGEDSLLFLNKEDRKKEMDYFRKDLETLSDNGVILADLNQSNTVYHNGIFLIDPGSYKFIREGTLKHSDKIRCYGMNIENINELLTSTLSGFSTNKKACVVKSYLESCCDDMIDYISSIEDNTLTEYVKRISKSR